MKCSINNKLKILIVSVLCIVVLGVLFLGVFGLNKTVDFKDGYEMQVTLNISVKDSSDVAKDACKDFFKDNGMSVKSFANQTADDGAVLIYKFDKDYTEKAQDLQDYVNAKLLSARVSGITAEVKTYKVSVSGYTQPLYVCLSLVIITVAAFVYLLLTTKLVGAVTVAATSVASAIIFIALMGLLRIPAYPYFATLLVFAFAFAAILSTVLVDRFKEERVNVGNNKYSNKEIVEIAYKKSVLRIAFICIAVMVFAVPICVLGGCYGAYLALGLLATVVSSVLAICTVTRIIYLAFNKADKNK